MKNKPRSASQRELRYLPAQRFEIRKNEDGTRTIAGYAATFGDLSLDLGGFREKIAPGAFTASLMDTSIDPLCLYDHNMANILGRRSSGTLTLSEDERGLKFQCQLPDTSVARDLTALMEREDIGNMSFGFACDSDSWDDIGGTVVRTLIAVRVYEVSVVASPAYPSSSVALRSCPADLRSRITVRDAGDCADDEQDEDGNCPGDADYDGDSDGDDEDRCECRCKACTEERCEECSNTGCYEERTNCNGCPYEERGGTVKTRKRTRNHRGAADAVKSKFKPLTKEQTNAYMDLLRRRL